MTEPTNAERTTKFQPGDKVAIIPHRSRNEGGSVKDVIGVVTDPRRETDMIRLNGDPVGFYVMVQIADKELGYHERSLEKLPN